MLEKISLSDSDLLYVIGDIIDRGKCGVDVALDIMDRPNVIFLRGNHEQMCIDDLIMHDWNAREIWRTNRGSVTRKDLLYRRSADERTRVLDFFIKSPTFADVTINECKYHLVHGMPADNDHDRLWNRPFANTIAPISGAIAVVGHTPVMELLSENLNNVSIWHGIGIIDIDCGCGHEFGRLACLRLDDMREFYI